MIPSNAPQWLKDADTDNANVEILPSGYVIWNSGNFLGGNFRGGNFLGGNFCGGNFLGGVINTRAATRIRTFNFYPYPYPVWAILYADGSRWVRMGCLWKSLAEWKSIGIRKSNLTEFPGDGSDRSEERVAAFEFARAAVLRMK